MRDLTITNLIILGLNLFVLALTVKLYTEILKDASQNRRAWKKTTAPEIEYPTDAFKEAE